VPFGCRGDAHDSATVPTPHVASEAVGCPTRLLLVAIYCGLVQNGIRQE